MTTLVTNGHTYTDDDNPITGMGAGGFRDRLLPMLSDVMLDSSGYMTAAQLAASSAATARGAAEAAQAAAAASASTAAGTQVTTTSTTNITPSLGDKSITIQSGKQLALNVPVYVVSRSDANVWMQCILKSYSGTAAVVTVVSFGTATAKADWNVSVSGAPGAKGDTASNTAFTPVVPTSAVLNLQNGQNYFKQTVAGTVNFTFSNVPANGSAITVEVQYDSGSMAFPASVKPPGDVWPTLATGKTHLLVLVTSNGGTSWRLAVAPGYSNG